jgi:hypothetical protein
MIFCLNSTESGFLPNFPYLSISAKLNLMRLRIAIGFHLNLLYSLCSNAEGRGMRGEKEWERE